MKLPGGRAGVAGFTVNRRVRTNQREPVFMPSHRLNRNIPPFDGVAGVAIRPELRAMNIRVTVSAFLADIGEHQLDVAPRALHFFVQALQRVMGFVVIEFRNAANRLPTQRGMAIFAGDVQPGAVRIPGNRLLRLGRGRTLGIDRDGHQQKTES